MTGVEQAGDQDCRGYDPALQVFYLELQPASADAERRRTAGAISRWQATFERWL